MSRRWRHLPPPRRGRYWSGAESSPVPAVPPPQPARQAGSWPRWAARLLPSRRRWYDPGWGQANQGQAYPSFTDPAGPRPRFGARPVTSRGRYSNPPWPQANQGQAWPSFTRQAGNSPKWAARLLPSRSRAWGPGWGQASQGQARPSFTRQAGAGTRFTRPPGRCQFTVPPAPPAAPPPRYLRPAGTLRAPAVLLPSPRRRWDPPRPQAARGPAPEFRFGTPYQRWQAEAPWFRWASGTPQAG